MLMMNFPELSVLLLVVNHIAFAIYIARYMPYDSFAQNIVNIITEIIFVLIEVFLNRLASQRSSSSDQDTRVLIGQYVVALFTLMMVIHLGLLVYETATTIIKKIRSKPKKEREEDTTPKKQEGINGPAY